MGGGTFDHDTYTSSKATRATKGIDDFAYSASASKVHANLDPKRINNKPVGMLESRDSAEHPNSNAVFVSFDVTGSNIENAREAQKKLPNLMTLLEKYLPDPQIAIAANDDINSIGHNSIQISDFESDNRIDEHIRNIWLTAQGGGNDGESYDLIIYAAARKVVMDCLEKRGRKGYFFAYADEPIFQQVEKEHVKNIFGDTIQADIPIAEIIEELSKKFHVFLIWPQDGYAHSREQYEQLFGEDHVLTLQHPNLICELIGSVIGLNEEKVGAADLVNDLVAVGTDSEDAHELTTALAKKLGSSIAKSSGDLPAVGGADAGATRL